ncbi:MAG: 5-formyltetrahydrofolate cyclo-ligase [Segetibacter sp.]
MLKNELRNTYKKKRIELPLAERAKLDDLLLIQLQNLYFSGDRQLLMSYWPLERHYEPNTLLYTRYLEHAIPALKVTFPVVDFKTFEMEAVLVHEDTDFIENKYGIPEPEEGEKIANEEIDIVFVPLLAFDKMGYRVGYGKGYYDRFLKTCRADVLSIGFSYFDAVDEIEDRNQFDVPLNYCITPHKIYEF